LSIIYLELVFCILKMIRALLKCLVIEYIKIKALLYIMYLVTDIWQYQNELLQSLYHLCSLYRLVGIPRDAVCYLSIGLRLAQSQALPAW